VGGANSAGQAAMFMSRTAKSVTLLVRGPSLEASMSYYLIQQIEKNDNITVRTCTEVVDTLGEDDHLTGLVLFDKQSGAKETVECDRLCCFIGAEPRTDWLDVVAKDDHGFILSARTSRTSAAGRWTVRRTTWKQVCPVCLLQVMCVPNPPNGWPQPSAKGRWQ
jgi:thioredoxin reductase (NADPH)